MKNTRFNRKLILSVIAAMLVVCVLDRHQLRCRHRLGIADL